MKENYDTKPHFSPYYNTFIQLVMTILSNWSFITHNIKVYVCVLMCVYIIHVCVVFMAVWALIHVWHIIHCIYLNKHSVCEIHSLSGVESDEQSY